MTIDKKHDTVILDYVSWEYYTHTLKEIGHGATRIIYDRGRMEIMTVSNQHERVKTAAARLLEAYADAKDLYLEGYGNVTLRREDLGGGLEPDECYYVSDRQPPLSHEGMDITHYPPPDLAIEVEISQGTLSKRSIYARLGVPELWRWDDGTMRVLRLQEDGTYVEASASALFPELPMNEFARCLALALKTTQQTAVKAWREHLKK